MKSLLVVLGLVAALIVPVAAASSPTDLTGRWVMIETDRWYGGNLGETMVQIEHEGDFVRIRAWDEHDTWQCQGTGRVEGSSLRFNWQGNRWWRGTCDLRIEGGGLRGTFQRLDVFAGVQYCVGKRAP